ncbi:hypothetical protein FPV67DRAFT_773397 [Lyophyllum atratum]|nr:hypothetical protein FPV67DRAFT_773397 [Lyophyllum atratum]
MRRQSAYTSNPHFDLVMRINRSGVQPSILRTTTMAPTRRQTNSPTTAEYRRTPPRRPTTEWYHDKNLTVSEYARKAVADRPPRVKFTSQEIEHYAKLYVKYILLAQAQNEAMAHDPKRLQESYLRVESRLARERQGMKPITEVTYAQIDAALEDFEEECKKAPETFDECVCIYYLFISLGRRLLFPTFRTVASCLPHTR